jgi:hypothetical protein
VKKGIGKYSTDEETLSLNINDNTIKIPKLTENYCNAYFLTVINTMNNAANNVYASLI